jgi:hypothetical protein
MNSKAASHCPTCGATPSASIATFESESSITDGFDAPGTRYYELLNSNEAPMESDWITVKLMISKADARLEDLDAEISRLRARDRVKQLEDERAMVLKYRAQNITILSPLRRMPPEILGKIFFRTLPLVSEVLESHSSDITRSPWVLSHISSRWRVVSLSTPALWSHIVIRRHINPPSMVETQVQRARTLKIHFYGNQDRDSELEIFRLLTEHSTRWTELHIELTSDLCPLLTSLCDRIPLLRKLWIQWHDRESQTAGESVNIFRSAPSLLDVGIFNEFRYVPVILPVHQLTRYYLDASWETHRGILELARNLIDANICISFKNEPWPAEVSIIELPALRHLYVEDTTVLNYLRTPALQEVGFSTMVGVDDPSFHFDPFLARSACTVLKLCVRGAPTAAHIGGILQNYPSITQLAILASNFEGDTDTLSYKVGHLLAHLTIPNPTGSAAVLPHLTHIDFGCEEHAYIDYDLHLQMLESRWRGENCALKGATLAIVLAPGPSPATLDGLRSLRNDGLDFVFVDGARGHDAMDAMDGWIYTPR